VTGDVIVNSNGTINVANNNATHSFNIGGNLTVNGTFDMALDNNSSCNVTFNGTGAKSISGSGSTPEFNVLTINNSGLTLSLSRNVIVDGANDGNVTISAGTFDLGSFTCNRSSNGGTFTVSNGATLKIGGTNSFPSNFNTTTLGNSSTVEYYRADNQTVFVTQYGNLTLSGSGTKTASGTIGVVQTFTNSSGITFSGTTLTLDGDTNTNSGTITLTGTLDFGNSNSDAFTNSGSVTAGTLTVHGTFTNNGTTIIQTSLDNGSGSGTRAFTQGTNSMLIFRGSAIAVNTFNISASGNTVEYDSNGTQTIRTETYQKLKVSGTGTRVLVGNITVNENLNLNGGFISTGSNIVIIGHSASVTRSSGHVIGNEQKSFNSGNNQSFTFDIGSSADRYTPVALSSMNITGGGNLTASTAGSDHPNIATSGIDSSRSVNRHWTFSSSLTLDTNDTFNAVFTFVSADVDTNSATNLFIIQRFSGSAWSDVTTGARTSTTTEAIGLTSFSDFAIGEPAAATRLVITGSTTQTAGTENNLTITAKTASGNTATSYTGDKSLTFSGANAAPNGAQPTVTNKDGSATNFGTATTITFVSRSRDSDIPGARWSHTYWQRGDIGHTDQWNGNG